MSVAWNSSALTESRAAAPDLSGVMPSPPPPPARPGSTPRPRCRVRSAKATDERIIRRRLRRRPDQLLDRRARAVAGLPFRAAAGVGVCVHAFRHLVFALLRGLAHHPAG